MAEDPTAPHTFVFAYRIAVPWLVHVLPFDHGVLVQRDRLAVLGRGRGGALPAARAPGDRAAPCPSRSPFVLVLSPPLLVASLRQGYNPDPLTVLVMVTGALFIVERRPVPLARDDARRRAEPRVGAVPRPARLRGLGAATARPRRARPRARRRRPGAGGVLRAALRDPDRRSRAGARLRRVADRRAHRRARATACARSSTSRRAAWRSSSARSGCSRRSRCATSPSRAAGSRARRRCASSGDVVRAGLGARRLRRGAGRLRRRRLDAAPPPPAARTGARALRADDLRLRRRTCSSPARRTSSTPGLPPYPLR